MLISPRSGPKFKTAVKEGSEEQPPAAIEVLKQQFCNRSSAIEAPHTLTLNVCMGEGATHTQSLMQWALAFERELPTH